MEKKFTEMRELEKQLSCPSGETGIELAKNMNESNIGMTLNTIKYLEIKEDNSILELGHVIADICENYWILQKESPIMVWKSLKQCGRKP